MKVHVGCHIRNTDLLTSDKKLARKVEMKPETMTIGRGKGQRLKGTSSDGGKSVLGEYKKHE